MRLGPRGECGVEENHAYIEKKDIVKTTHKVATRTSLRLTAWGRILTFEGQVPAGGKQY